MTGFGRGSKSESSSLLSFFTFLCLLCCFPLVPVQNRELMTFMGHYKGSERYFASSSWLTPLDSCGMQHTLSIPSFLSQLLSHSYYYHTLPSISSSMKHWQVHRGRSSPYSSSPINSELMPLLDPYKVSVHVLIVGVGVA